MKKSLSVSLALLMIIATFSVFSVSGFAAEEIVQDGLVSWFDGDTFTDGEDGKKVWTDKKGANGITGCVGTFKDGAYVLEPGEMQNLPVDLYKVLWGEEYTIELNLGAFAANDGMTYIPFICNNNGTNAEKFALYIQISNGKFFAKTSGLGSSARPNFEGAVEKLQNATLAVTYKNGGKVSVYVNGELIVAGNAPATNGNTGTTFMIGNNNNKKMAHIEYEGMRFYSKELTADQVKANAAVDNTVPQSVVELNGAAFNSNMENWLNSSNNPNGVGKAPGVTEILFGVTPTDTVKIDAIGKLFTEKSNYTWTLKISDGKSTLEKSFAPASFFTYSGNYFFRFEPCMENDPFVPVKGTTYQIDLTIENEATKYVIKGANNGFTLNDNPVKADGTYYEGEKPVDPPVTGEHAVVFVVVALVALFGTAFVVTKKVTAR